MGATASLTNSTFFSNYTTWVGGAIANNESMTVTNCTFSNNTSKHGGAIENSHNLLLRNSIIANSMLGPNCSGYVPITDGGGNLRWPADDDSCVGSHGNPQLAPLGQNGGSTHTMAITIGSEAIRLATANCPASDQRGAIRSLAPTRCDTGAFEWQGWYFFFPTIYRNLAP